MISPFRNFITKPNNPLCRVIDSTRLMVEVLWGLEHAEDEFWGSSYASKMLLDGNCSLVVRYKREKGDEEYRPACALSFDMDEARGVTIRQLQGSNDRVAFHFHSSFQSTAFFLKIIEESFIKKGIPVTVAGVPEGLEGASYASQAIDRYEKLRTAVIGMTNQYNSRNKA